jgi:hypothetical protein
MLKLGAIPRKETLEMKLEVETNGFRCCIHLDPNLINTIIMLIRNFPWW